MNIINKLRLRSWLCFYITDIYDQIQINARSSIYFSSSQSKTFFDMRFSELTGMLHCVENMASYFNISIKPNPIYNLIYIFNIINNFNDKLIDFSNENVFIPNYIKYPNEYLDGYDEIIKNIRKNLL